MKSTALLIATAVVLSGCGSGSEPLPDLNPAFGGTWTGNTVVAVPGIDLGTMTGTLEVAVSGKTATITRVCPDGSGSVTATGSGNAAAWSGRLVCPPVAVGTCPAVTATLTSAHGSLGTDATVLTVLGAGTVSGCSFSSSATLTFTGTK